jgi:sialic acid synthase SpsE
MWCDRSVTMTVGSRRIGSGEPLYTIAEIGLNHGGSVDRALAMIDAAAAAGVSAVKLQTLTAGELVAPACPAPVHLTARSLRDFFATFELSEPAHRALAARARAHGLGLLATPLSLGAVDLLARVGIDAYKIASGDIIWDQLIRRCAGTGKPLVVSTGLASLDEVAHALTCARSAGAAAVALTHCVSAYPVPGGSENLRAIATLGRAFGVPVGLSDHGADEFAVPIAVAMGASLYERHLMLDDDQGAVDAAVSSTPERLAAVVRAAARARAALGSGEKVCLPAEAPNLSASRRSLCAARRLPAGYILHENDMVALRPADGFALARAADLVGRRLVRDVDEGSPLVEQDIEEDILRCAESRLDRGVA